MTQISKNLTPCENIRKNNCIKTKIAQKKTSEEVFLKNGGDGDDVGVCEGMKPEHYSDTWAFRPNRR